MSQLLSPIKMEEDAVIKIDDDADAVEVDDEYLNEPIWMGGAEVQTQLDAVIKQPLEHPELFDPILLPVRRLVAVWAPAGSGKRMALVQYCASLMLYDAFTVICASDWRGQLMYELEKRKDAAHRSRPLRIVVVEQADELIAYNSHAPYAHDLDAMAERLGVILVCLFDRVIPQDVPKATEFLAQFTTANIYFPPPNSTFLRGYLRYWMERYQQRYRAWVRITLTEGDYVALSSEHARDAPISCVHAWLRSIFYPVIAMAKEGDPVGVNMAELLSPPYMTTSAKGINDPYILPRDPRPGLNEFTCTVGMGPIYVMPKKKRIVKEEEGGGESDAKKICLTDPTTETLGGDFLPLE